MEFSEINDGVAMFNSSAKEIIRGRIGFIAIGKNPNERLPHTLLNWYGAQRLTMNQAEMVVAGNVALLHQLSGSGQFDDTTMEEKLFGTIKDGIDALDNGTTALREQKLSVT
jgi:hypothetical protein